MRDGSAQGTVMASDQATRDDAQAIAAADVMPASALTLAIYACGGVVYALLCGPAIGQRGFPPIDPAWTAMTFLWISPILLASILDARPLKDRWRGLFVYSIATGFFDAASTVMVVPHHVDLLGSAVMAVTAFGPFHFLVGLLIGLIAQGIRAAVRKGRPRLSPTVANASQLSLAAGIIALTAAFPFLFRQYFFDSQQKRGRAQAEKDWVDETVRIYVTNIPESEGVSHEYDPATGFQYRRKWPESRYSLAYNERVRELLQERGVPVWSMKGHLVPDEVLLKVLHANALEEVTTFPHEINESIVLFRGGTIHRWNSTMSSADDSLSIAAKETGLIGIGSTAEPAYVVRFPEHPTVIFIRNGCSWVGAFHESGRLLSSAGRF